MQVYRFDVQVLSDLCSVLRFTFDNSRFSLIQTDSLSRGHLCSNAANLSWIQINLIALSRSPNLS